MLKSLEFTQTLLWLANYSLLAVFVLAAAAKLRDTEHARAALTNFGVPERWTQLFLMALVLAELGTAALLAWPPAQPVGALGALALLLAFTVAMAAQLLRGQRPTCACFGTFAKSPISWRSVGRNGLLMALAAGLIAWPKIDGASLSLGASALPALVVISWAALGTLWLFHLTRQHGRLLLRIEQLEHNPIVAPSPQPLQVGAALPPLNLSDTQGRPFEPRRFRGLPIQILFLDEGCTHCLALIAHLHEVPFADINTAFIVISETAALRQQLPAEVVLLVDPGWSTMTLFGLRGTPAAVSVDANGALAQLAVHGTAAVRAAIAAIAAIDRIASSDPINNREEEVQHEFATV